MNRRDVLQMALASAGLGGDGRPGAAGRREASRVARCHAAEAAVLAGLQPAGRLPGPTQTNCSMSATSPTSPTWDSTSSGSRSTTTTGPISDNPKNLKEPVLKQIDRAVELGKQHGIHLLLDFHIAPGFGQISPPERTNLWTESEPAELCAYQWSVFAERYKGVPNSRLSFNLFNEPDNKVKPEDLRRVTEQLVRAIRAKDPDRLIIVDGRNWARTPITELLGLNVAADIHSYDPMPVTHYKARGPTGTRAGPLPPGRSRSGTARSWTARRSAARCSRPGRSWKRRASACSSASGASTSTRRTRWPWRGYATCSDYQGGRLGLGPVELRRQFRRLRQRPGGREVRDVARPQARPGHGRALAGVLRPEPGDDKVKM